MQTPTPKPGWNVALDVLSGLFLVNIVVHGTDFGNNFANAGMNMSAKTRPHFCIFPFVLQEEEVAVALLHNTTLGLTFHTTSSFLVSFTHAQK